MARFGIRSFRAHYPWLLLATTLLPRQFVLCVFLVYLSHVAGGTNSAFAFVGATVYAQTIVMINVADIAIDDRVNATEPVLRTAIPSTVRVLAARLLPYPLFALACSAVALAAGPVVGEGARATQLLAGAPVYLVSGISIVAAGAAFAGMVRTAEELVGNTILWLTLLSGGIVPDDIPRWCAPLIDLLPGRHAEHALDAHLAGHSMVPGVTAELAVAAWWFTVAVAVSLLRGRHERRHGGAM